MSVIAVDIGGTFTDIIYVRKDGSLGFLKVLSTPRSPEVAVIEGVKLVLREIEHVKEVVHATTIATNILRGQLGLEIPRTALLVTKGFRDIIEIARQNRPKLYDLFFEKPKPLVPRELRFEVDERINYKGEVLKPLNTSEVEAIGKKFGELGVKAAAVVFLHSYANPIHEDIAGHILRKYVKYVSLSHEVAPEPREYERASTTVVNAILMPVVSEYISRLLNSLLHFGVKRLYVMSSSGGLVTPEEVCERPVQVIESGPAAGVVAAAEFAKMLGIPSVISFDMGGTTAKAGTVVNYEFEITTEYEVGGESHHGRVVKGSGYPIRFPFIDLAEVSAGGGTIIWRDKAGALRVGPVSAGADPGPACYRRGGTKPTLTDANLVLGRIGEYILGGTMKLDKEAALKALSELGNPYDVALEAIRLASLEMARAIRLVTVERGLDPSSFTLVAFGGAGPQFAAELAEEIGIKSIIVPPHPGCFSAMGLLMADWRFEARKSFPDPYRLEEEYSELEKRLLEKSGSVDYFLRYADIRYVGQGWELVVPASKPVTLKHLKESFEEKHVATFGFKLDRDIEVVVIRVFAVKSRPKLKLPQPRKDGRAEPKERRVVYFDKGAFEAPVYWRDDIPVNTELEGPAIIEEYDSTIVVPDGWKAYCGSLGELWLRKVR